MFVHIFNTLPVSYIFYLFDCASEVVFDMLSVRVFLTSVSLSQFPSHETYSSSDKHVKYSHTFKTVFAFFQFDFKGELLQTIWTIT